MFNQTTTTLILVLATLVTLWIASSSAAPYSELIDRQQKQELGVQLQLALENNPFLVTLGTINGKTYYMDRSATRTWEEAKTYATSMNMKLAEIVSLAEAQFLYGLPPEDLPRGFYWTGGRDSTLITQHIWDTSRTAPSEYPQIDWFNAGIFRTCITLYVYTWTRFYSHPKSCTDTYFVLLQSP